MNEPVSDATWRNRFILVNLVRIGATLLVLFGILWWQTDYIQPGGNVAGFVLAMAALAVSFFAPRWFARRWKTPPQ